MWELLAQQPGITSGLDAWMPAILSGISGLILTLFGAITVLWRNVEGRLKKVEASEEECQKLKANLMAENARMESRLDSIEKREARERETK